MDGPRTASQKASLAGVLNPDENRDSAYFSSTDASSKHTSAASGLAVGVLSPTGSGYHSSPNDKTPSPTVVSSVPQTVISPSQSNMSVAAMVSPTTPGSADPRRQERPTSIESGPPSATLEPNLHPVSRRESVDSRMNQGFSDMRLGASSPYASHNQSTTSIQNTLHQQRNPRPGFNDFAGHRISNGYQPSADRDPHSNRAVRTAPTITGPATSQIARAAEPTKGQAWAFPEDEAPGQRTAAQNSLLDSRRSSIAESIASSQFTYESRLPTGQRHLEDDYSRPSGASTEFPPVHHHSLQHKQLGDLMDEDAASRTGAQPYSRTPELRKSHKLAERKRRTEMKELFDQLRDLMPQERGSKASKWEILTKAISEHERLQGAFRHLQAQHINLSNENEKLRRDYQNLLYQTRGTQPQQAPAAPPPPAGAYPPSDPYVHRTELPPLRTLNGGAPNGPESMTGVQYEPPQANGYRPVDRY